MARKTAIRHRPLTPESRDLRDYIHQVKAMGYGKRPTAERLSKALDLSLNRTQMLIKEGLTSEDVITLSEYYQLNPVLTLVDFGFLTMEQVYDAAKNGNIHEENPKALRRPYEISGERLFELMAKYGGENLTLTVNFDGDKE